MITLQPELRECKGKLVRFYSPSQIEEIRHAYMLRNAKEERPHGLHPLACNGIHYSSGHHNLGYLKIPI